MKKQKSPKGTAAKAPSQEAISDPRFTSFTTDPRFRLPSKKHTRTKIDKRFSRMLKDDSFSNTAKVDRYGRKLDSNKKKEALQRLYRGEDEDDVDDEVNKGENRGKDSVEKSDIDVEDDEVVEKELRRADASAKAAYDPARGGGFSSSDDDDNDDEEEDDSVEVEDVPEFPDRQLDRAGVPIGEVTSRVAVVNLDWDNIRAVDLMAVFSSFLRGTGRIEKVLIYKSDFGKERMEREEMEGPPKEIFAKKGRADEALVDEEEDSNIESEGDEEDEEDEDKVDEKIMKDLLQEDDGQEFDNAALRQYQLERLRYYYSVVVCSDKETANHIYEATDGTEYLSSANFFDLRFIPDDVEFDEKPSDECASLPTKYRPTEFVTDALRNSKVKLTWEAEDTERKEVIKRAFSGSRAEIGENDLRAYLGSDSSDDENEEIDGEDKNDAPKLTKKELARQKMREALGLSDSPSKPISKINKAGPVGDMQITFTSGLNLKEQSGIFENEPITEENTAKAYIRKEKERKARRKEKAKAIREGRDLIAIKDSTDVEAQIISEEEQPFDDPFFSTDEAAKVKASKKLRKEERRAKRETKAEEAAAQASERAALRLLMVDNVTSSAAAADRLDHFDINEIARAEKDAKKKKKRQWSKSNKGEAADVDDGSGKRGGLQADFEMDVADPRFAAVFDKHEFAIDPTNPKFRGTEGMKKLLEEGRMKRQRQGKVPSEEDEASLEKSIQMKKRKMDQVGGQSDRKGKVLVKAAGSGLRGLVESVKKKARR